MEIANSLWFVVKEVYCVLVAIIAIWLLMASWKLVGCSADYMEELARKVKNENDAYDKRHPFNR